MISQLKIQNLAIIDCLELDFREGFFAVTGETGAGKSILFQAIALCIGGRARSDIIRQGEEKASIELVVELSISQLDRLRPIFEENDLELDDSLHIKRVLKSGRNRIYVNGGRTTIQVLQQIGQGVVDIIGQHASHSLLSVSSHLQILDRFSGLQERVAILREGVIQLNALRREMNALVSQEDQRRLKIKRIRIQLDDIEKAGLQEGEDLRLSIEIAKNEHAEQLREECRLSAYRISGADGSVVDHLSASLNGLMRISHVEPELEAIVDQLSQFKIELSEMGRDLGRMAQSVSSHPEELEMMQDRLYLIEELKRRHGGDIATVLAAQQALQAEFEQLISQSDRISEVKEEIDQLERVLMSEAKDVSVIRQRYAEKMQQLVEEELAQLGMPHCRFRVYFSSATDEREEHSLGLYGIDDVEYLISPNPGEGFKPMVQVASGGELSRILLALKVALIQTDPAGTYIFDEVDTGIGGGIAEIVGQKLQKIGQSRQVLCISHLPQVISCAHNHIKIEKRVASERTSSSARHLCFDERVDELARMLGGTTVTEKTLAHAREMLRLNSPTSAQSERLHLVRA